MFDHVSINVSDYQKSKDFYEKALKPFGYKVIAGEDGVYCGFGVERPRFWLGKTDDKHVTTHGAHIAFRAEDRATVEAFYKAAVEAGGKENGAPGLRPEYSEDYYGAFVIDPDGNNVEAVTFSSN
jgi:catechol 2,3-dioxygenase-like lactoylglutathione lyase family enzyme